MATIEQVHAGSGSDNPLHLIFIHGLGGHVRRTWMHDPEDSKSLWPEWVGEELQCPVWLLGYDAALSAWRGGAMPLPHQGATVLDLLATQSQLRDARLILIGHSMGGLVIKTALVDAATLGVERYKFFPKQLRGVVFVATPHFGAHLASLATGLRKILRTNEQVGDMRAYDPHLTTLNTQFRAQHKRLGFSVRSFCEAHGVALPGRFFGLRPSPAIRVVDGADPHVDGDSGIYLPEDHFSICKPLNRESQIFTSSVSFIQDIEKRESNPFYNFQEQEDASAGVMESKDALTAFVNGCEIRIVAGRLEDQAAVPGVAVVLPCNEYFDDKCAEDTRSVLGAYVAAKLGGRVAEFNKLVKEQCRLRFGAGKQREKTEIEDGESFGVGKCLLLTSQLEGSTPIALISTTTQRPGEGLAARVSDLFSGIEELANRMADARLNEAIMPVLGAGHGGLTPTAALCGLLLAIAQVARRPKTRFRRITVVVFRRDSQSHLEIAPQKIRQALALIATNPQEFRNY